MKALYDVDDLVNERQIIDHLRPLYQSNPAFRVTCYAIPNKLGAVHALRERYPWVIFGIHGFEHVPFECRAWTEDDATFYLTRALEMGYDKLFKPPNWIWDDETMKAVETLGLTFHHHPDDKEIAKWAGRVALYPHAAARDVPNLHTHITPNAVTDSILIHPAFTPERVWQFGEFLDPMQAASPVMERLP